MTYLGLGQAQKRGRVKQVDEIPTLLH